MNPQTRVQRRPLSILACLATLCALGVASVPACSSDHAAPGGDVDGKPFDGGGGWVGGIDDGGPGDAPAVAELDEVVMRLSQAAWFHAAQASPFQNQPSGAPRTWTTGQCTVWGQVEASLDGAAAPGVLPAGSHTFSVTFFDECMEGDPMAGKGLTGMISAAYVTADWDELTAEVSASSMWVVCCSGGYDFTANGGGTWSRSLTTSTMTYAPSVGSTLTNNRTGRMATFGGGSYSTGFRSTPYGGWLQSGRADFNDLTIALGGTSYVLSGRLEVEPLYRTTGHGELRITSNGSLVARLYADASGMLRTEVLTPLGPF
jgi:hypothetical protein